MLRARLAALAAVLVLAVSPSAYAGTGDIDLPDGGGIDIHGHDDGAPAGDEGEATPIGAGDVEEPLDPAKDCYIVNVSGDCPLGGEMPPDQTEAVDVAALAQDAYDSIRFATPLVRTSPGAPHSAIVGLETWLWLDGGSWRTSRAEATAGDVTVTAEATPTSVVWDLGEKRVVCRGPGKPWRKGLGPTATTSCGYTFRHSSVHEPKGKYPVRVQVNYGVSWRCEGDCDEADGDLGTIASPTAVTALRVTERQSVVVR